MGTMIKTMTMITTMITTMRTTMRTTMIVVVASLLLVEVVVDVVDVVDKVDVVEGQGVVLDGRPMTPGSKTHLRRTITVTVDVADGVKSVVQAITIPTVAVDGVGGVVLATTTMAITMTLTTTMTLTMTLTLTMTIDAMDGVVEVVMEGRCMASVLMGLNRLVQTTRGQTSVLTAPYQPGSRLARQEEDHDVQTTKCLSVLMEPDLSTGSAKTQVNPPAPMDLPQWQRPNSKASLSKQPSCAASREWFEEINHSCPAPILASILVERLRA